MSNENEAFNAFIGTYGFVLDDFNLGLAKDCWQAAKSDSAQDIMKWQIQVEKLLCDVVGREWQPAGFSIETLIADIKKAKADSAQEIAELKTIIKELWYVHRCVIDGIQALKGAAHE